MSRFVMQADMTTDHVDWGTIGWRTRPENTACKTFVVMDVGLEPGFGHDFHKHPEQDELITVLAGTIEQWIEGEKQVLEVGDSVYLDKDVVHASFNVGDVPARMFVVLAPSVGEEGYQLVDMAGEEPWSGLR